MEVCDHAPMLERIAVLEEFKDNSKDNITSIKESIDKLFDKVDTINIKIAIASGVIIAVNFIGIAALNFLK